MTVTEYLFASLAEECNEVAQRCTKALRFGDEEIQPGQPYDNSQRVMDELIDVRVIVELLREAGLISLIPNEADEIIETATQMKRASFVFGLGVGLIAGIVVGAWIGMRIAI